MAGNFVGTRGLEERLKYSRGNRDNELNLLNVFAIIISDKISIQMIKMKKLLIANKGKNKQSFNTEIRHETA